MNVFLLKFTHTFRGGYEYNPLTLLRAPLSRNPICYQKRALMLTIANKKCVTSIYKRVMYTTCNVHIVQRPGHFSILRGRKCRCHIVHL